MASITVQYARTGIWRFSRSDAILVALAALHVAILIVWPVAPVDALVGRPAPGVARAPCATVTVVAALRPAASPPSLSGSPTAVTGHSPGHHCGRRAFSEVGADSERTSSCGPPHNRRF